MAGATRPPAQATRVDPRVALGSSGRQRWFRTISRVFLSYWNEQKCPLTRMEEVFITLVEKRTVMCLYGVTRRSDLFSPNSCD